MPSQVMKNNNCKINPDLNLIKKEYKGYLSDIVPMETPILISNAQRLKEVLISSVAKKRPRYFEDDKSWMLENNIFDPFVNNDYTIDFLKQDILVVRGATIAKVTYSDDEYKVIYGDKIEDYCYAAVVVQAPSGVAKPKGFTCINDKPTLEVIDRVFIP